MHLHDFLPRPAVPLELISSRLEKLPPLRAVLFDVTNTLVVPAEAVGVTYARIAAAHGVHCEAAKLERAFRAALAVAPPRVFPNCSFEEACRRERLWWRSRVEEIFMEVDGRLRFADFDIFFEALFTSYAGPEAWRCLPRTLPLLEYLAGLKLRMGVVSNFDHRLPDILQALDLESFFDIVAHPARQGLAKPDPAVFRWALAELGIPVEAAAYIGHDRVLDLDAARAAGLRAFEFGPRASAEALSAQLDRLAKVGA